MFENDPFAVTRNPNTPDVLGVMPPLLHRYQGRRRRPDQLFISAGSAVLAGMLTGLFASIGTYVFSMLPGLRNTTRITRWWAAKELK
jgi:hypothetical protein